MKKILFLLLLVSPAAFGQLSFSDMTTFYSLRANRDGFAEKALSLGMVPRKTPSPNAYDSFLDHGRKTALFVKWGDDIVFRFREYSTYGRLEQELKAQGFTRGYRHWYDRDEALHYTDGKVEVILWKYNFRTTEISYGLAVLPRMPESRLPTR